MGKINDLCNIFRRTNKIKGGKDSQPLPQNTETKIDNIYKRIRCIRQLAKNKKYKSYSDKINEVLDYCEEKLKTITRLNPKEDIETIKEIVEDVKGKLNELDGYLGDIVMPR